MATKSENKTKGIPVVAAELGAFFGKIVSFNTSLKLYHWHVTGEGSYAEHIALDQAIGSLLGVTDRLVETSIAQAGNLDIDVPKTDTPTNIVNHVCGFYDFVEENRGLFTESFSESIIDDYQETLQQLLYRLKRLK